MEQAIESPCVGVCRIEPGRGVCVGCGRTLEEIAAWARMTPQARRLVMARLQARTPGETPTPAHR
jgi:hypothetical protein